MNMMEPRSHCLGVRGRLLGGVLEVRWRWRRLAKVLVSGTTVV